MPNETATWNDMKSHRSKIVFNAGHAQKTAETFGHLWSHAARRSPKKQAAQRINSRLARTIDCVDRRRRTREGPEPAELAHSSGECRERKGPVDVLKKKSSGTQGGRAGLLVDQVSGRTNGRETCGQSCSEVGHDRTLCPAQQPSCPKKPTEF